VVRVQKRFPAAADVELKYRRPVAVVRVEPRGESRLLFIDESGVLLPTEDFSAEQGKEFLRIEAAGDVPTSGYGLPWQSERIIGAARLAAIWQERWQPLGLFKIASLQTADGQVLYELHAARRAGDLGALPGRRRRASRLQNKRSRRWALRPRQRPARSRRRRGPDRPANFGRGEYHGREADHGQEAVTG
jgi:hypothetical protein